jgi:hypothetical protein
VTSASLECLALKLIIAFSYITILEEQAREILTGKAKVMTEVEIIRLKTEAKQRNQVISDR